MTKSTVTGVELFLGTKGLLEMGRFWSFISARISSLLTSMGVGDGGRFPPSLFNEETGSKSSNFVGAGVTTEKESEDGEAAMETASEAASAAAASTEGVTFSLTRGSA